MSEQDEHGVWLPLRWRDLDYFGHVYHAEFLTLLDEARSRWFAGALALEQADSYVLARLEIDYVSALVLADEAVAVEFGVERVGTTSLTLRETMRARDGRVVAKSRSVTVRWDRDAGTSRTLSESERETASRFLLPDDAV